MSKASHLLVFFGAGILTAAIPQEIASNSRNLCNLLSINISDYNVFELRNWIREEVQLYAVALAYILLAICYYFGRFKARQGISGEVFLYSAIYFAGFYVGFFLFSKSF